VAINDEAKDEFKDEAKDEAGATGVLEVSTEVMFTSLAQIEFPLHSPVRETLTPVV
jgi:hypothetical protein